METPEGKDLKPKMDLREKLARSSAWHVDRARLHWLFSMGVVCLVMGGMLAVQVRSRTPEGQTLANRFRQVESGPLSAFGQIYAASQREIDRQNAEIIKLRKENSDYLIAASREQNVVKPLVKQLMDFKVSLGLTAAKGPGIILEVKDSTIRVGDNPEGSLPEMQNMLLIHDTDLLQITNELWAAGAEAISLNGQRIVGGTAIRCVGPATSVNDVRVTAPYRFVVLGDAASLANSLNIPGGVLDRLRPLKFPITLEQKDQLVVPAVSAARVFRLAKPAEPTEEKPAAAK
jgi:uncharacterized protein YlxW (UPF0749 family)